MPGTLLLRGPFPVRVPVVACLPVTVRLTLWLLDKMHSDDCISSYPCKLEVKRSMALIQHFRNLNGQHQSALCFKPLPSSQQASVFVVYFSHPRYVLDVMHHRALSLPMDTLVPRFTSRVTQCRRVGRDETGTRGCMVNSIKLTKD